MTYKNKNFIPILIISLFVLGLGAIWVARIIPEKPAKHMISLSDAVAEIEYCRKLLKYPFPEERHETTRDKIGMAFRAWEIFIDSFGVNQPPEYGQSKNWPKEMTTIREHSRKANELIGESKETEAIAEMDKAYEIYLEIKKENKIDDRFDQTMEFYILSRQVGKSPDKEGTKSKLNDLKLVFTDLKQAKVDTEYSRLVTILELAIMDIERLLPGPDFKRAQAKLLSCAEALFWQY